jgi:hypothetical protein
MLLNAWAEQHIQCASNAENTDIFNCFDFVFRKQAYDEQTSINNKLNARLLFSF